MPASKEMPMKPTPSSRLNATRRRKAGSGSRACPRCSQGCSQWRLRLEPACIDVLDESDEPVHVNLLVVVLGQVAAVGAKQEARVRNLLRHPFHVLRVHGV